MSNDEASLGDYIGSLISEVSRARMQVDMEAKAIALLYKQDPLLQHFPIPRFRIPEMEIEASVVLGSIQPASKLDAPVQKDLDFTRLKKNILAQLKLRPVLFNKKKAGTYFNQAIVNLKGKDLTLRVVEDEFCNAAFKALNPNKIIARENRLKNIIKVIISSEVRIFMGKSSFIGVSALSSDIIEHSRDENGQGSLVKLKMKITEEAYQWSIIENDDENDENDEILVPE